MTAVNTAEFIPYSPQQMFELVNDIEAYPQFLPWVRTGKVERRTDKSIVATLMVANGPLKHSFTTENRLSEFERIEMHLIKGPFKRFNGVWRFDATAGGCNVALNLEFEFSNRLLAGALAKVFKMLTSSMVSAFRNRAQALYG